MQVSTEEKDNLARSTKKVNRESDALTEERRARGEGMYRGAQKDSDKEVRIKYYFKESLIGTCSNTRMEEDAEEEDGDISGDDIA